MTKEDRGGAQGEIHSLISRLNDAWMHKRGVEMTQVLNGCFAEDVVMRGPGFVFLGEGRDFAVQSYHDFLAQASIDKFVFEEPQIDVVGNMGMAHYKWEMTYRLGGQEYPEHGHDVIALSRESGHWLVIWRALLTEPNS